ncbi:hypothetical protein [Metabacillus fastidiosus]|uniref:hypothetical protein n=1 Tax=Metabacillus fastidiosus TaxID=1458 RepID=UPI002DBC8881|nr:hypothetical protein [Metabacillus fastidiosus]MEC2077311.1 hypothetical protein [Metabacillus fastidiosus]
MSLIENKFNGIIIVASENVLSKYEFLYSLATLLGKEKYVKRSKMNPLQSVKRADSLGLDVTKLKDILVENSIPSSNQVIQKLVEEYKEGAFREL